MESELKPYEDYKEIGLFYIERVPKHWKLLRNKYIFSERNIRSKCGEEELLSLSQYTGVSRKKDKKLVGKGLVTNAKSLVGYKIVKPFDLVVNIMLAWNGSLGISKYDGIISPAYCIFKVNENYNPWYFHYLLKTGTMTTAFKTLSTGVIESRLRLYPESFYQLYSLIPPKEEQDQIVRYLDSKLSKINKFIKAKKKQIELLKEQKQAIINQAVTKGLDPNVKMKPSGIEWLGDIPEGWEIRRIKNISRVNPALNDYLDKYLLENKVVFLPMEKISEHGEIDNSELRAIKEVKNGFTGFERNDVVIAKITPCFENGKGACLDTLKTDIGFGTTELIVLRANEEALPKFLDLIVRTSYFRNLGARNMTGSAGQKRVPVEFVANFSLGIPIIDEQQKIVSYIVTKVFTINKSIEVIKKEIDLITEYRNSLISAVVTGKVDVRHIKVEEVIEEIGGGFEGLEESDVDEDIEIGEE